VRRFIRFLPLALLLAIVFALSSQPRDQQSIVPLLSRYLPQEALASLLPDVKVRYGRVEEAAKASPYRFLDLIFRKSAHIILYTSIGLALYTAFGGSASRRRPMAKWLGILAGLAVIAILDEWNQTRVPMRSGQALDVWLDVTGGMLGTAAVLWLWRRMKQSRRNRRDLRISFTDHRKPQG